MVLLTFCVSPAESNWNLLSPYSGSRLLHLPSGFTSCWHCYSLSHQNPSNAKYSFQSFSHLTSALHFVTNELSLILEVLFSWPPRHQPILVLLFPRASFSVSPGYSILTLLWVLSVGVTKDFILWFSFIHFVIPLFNPSIGIYGFQYKIKFFSLASLLHEFSNLVVKKWLAVPCYFMLFHASLPFYKPSPRWFFCLVRLVSFIFCC